MLARFAECARVCQVFAFRRQTIYRDNIAIVDTEAKILRKTLLPARTFGRKKKTPEKLSPSSLRLPLPSHFHLLPAACLYVSCARARPVPALAQGTPVPCAAPLSRALPPARPPATSGPPRRGSSCSLALRLCAPSSARARFARLPARAHFLRPPAAPWRPLSGAPCVPRACLPCTGWSAPAKSCALARCTCARSCTLCAPARRIVLVAYARCALDPERSLAALRSPFDAHPPCLYGFLWGLSSSQCPCSTARVHWRDTRLAPAFASTQWAQGRGCGCDAPVPPLGGVRPRHGLFFQARCLVL